MNPIIYRTEQTGSRLRLRRWFSYVKVLLLCTYGISFTIGLQAQTGPPTPVVAVVQNYGLQVSNALPGQARFRTYVFQNTGTANYTGPIELKYLQMDGRLEVQSLRVFTCNNDPTTFLNSTDPGFVVDPLTGLAPATATPICTTYTANSVPTAANATSWSETINVTIPINNFICVVEEVNPQECITTATILDSKIEINYSGVTPNLTSTQPSSIATRAVSITMPRVYNTIPSPTAPSMVGNFTDVVGGSSCSGSDIQRSVTYTLTGRSLKDPLIRVLLNTGNSGIISLLEVDDADVDISMSLDLDGDGINETSINNVPLSHILNEPNNSFFTDTRVKEDAAGAVSPAHVTPTDAQINSSWLMDPSIGYPRNFAGDLKANSVVYVPSLKDASTPKLSGFSLHLSRLIVPVGGTTAAPFNQAQVTNFDIETSAFTYAMNVPSPTGNTAYDDAFIEIHPGSSFTINYKGTHVPQGGMDPSFDHFRNAQARTNIETFQLTGFTTCPATILNRRRILTQGGGVTISQTITPDNQTSLLLMGNGDNQTNTIDGQLGNVVFKLDNFTQMWRFPQRSLNVDYSCSEIEMVVEFDAGLGVPCPGNLGSNITLNTGSCSAGDAFGLSSGTYYQSSNSSLTCGTPAGVPFEDKVEIDEFFKFVSGGKDIFPKSVIIEPIDPNDCSTSGQRWIARFSMSDFLDNPNGTNISRMDGELFLKVKAYCPAQEPSVNINLKTYLYPELCDTRPLVITANDVTCNGTCSQSSCPEENRFFLGSGNNSLFVTCPGCLTPGWSIRPNVVKPQRHSDYLGYVDADDDGKPDLDPSGNPIPMTDTSAADLSKVRYGDVMTMDFTGNMFKGETDPTKNGFTSSQLSIYPSGPQLFLDKMVCDIEASPGFRNFFQPIVVDGAITTDILDEMDAPDYLAYESQYASFLEFNLDGVGPATQLPIDASHIAWLSASQLRVAFTIDEIYQADASFSGTIPEYFTSETVQFRMRYISDMDGTPRGNTLGQRLLEFNLLMYSTDISMTQLLGTATTVPFTNLTEHSATLPDAKSAQTWWCEAGVGQIKVVPHTESRYIANQRGYDSNDAAYRDNALQFPQISRTAEVGPIINFQSGLKNGTPSNSRNNVNYFKNEVRTTSLPTEMVFYVPKPYAPEALTITNNVLSRSDLYDGLESVDVAITDPNYYTSYVIDLKDPNTHQLPNIPTGGQVTLGFGVTIEEGVFMDPAYYPTDASGPLFDVSNAVEHYKITVPLDFYYKASQYNNTHAFQLNDGLKANNYRQYFNATDVSQYPNAVPLALGDEYQAMNGYVVYSMPQCNGAAITEDCDFMTEHENFLYYFGNYNRTSRMSNNAYNGVTNFTTYDPLNNATNIDYQLAPRLYGSRETPLLCPQQVLTAPKVMPNVTAPMLSTLASGVNNYPVAGGIYPGVVPASTVGNNYFGEQGQAQTVLNFFFTQHSDIEAEQVLNVQFDPLTSEFSFQFSLEDQKLQQLRPQAGPCGIVDGTTYSDLDDFLTQSGSGALANDDLLRYMKGGLAPRFAAIDLSNLYFYLEPVVDPNNSNSLLLDLSKDILITDVNRAGYKPQTAGSFGTGVAPGLSNGDPRLFYIGDILAARKVGNNGKNVVTVKGKFNCNDPSTIAKINQSNTNGISFPFNLHVNYSTQMDKATLAVPQALNTLGKPELSYHEAKLTKCSNDDTIGGFVLNVPQVFMTTSLNVSGGDQCAPTGTLTVTNLGGSILELQQVELSGLPQGTLASPWVYDVGTSLYTYPMTTTSGSTTVGTDLASATSMNVVLNFNAATCQNLGATFNISTVVSAKTYCSDCDASSNAASCQITETATGTLQMGSVNFRDFSTYQAFANPCATLETGGTVKINWNPIIKGSDLTQLATYGANDQYTFDFDIGSTNFIRTLSANASTISNFFNGSYSINASDLAQLCAGNALQIKLNSVKVASGCGVLSCDTTHLLGTTCDVYHSPMVLTTSAIDATCQGLADGAATVSTQGMAPFTYLWNNSQTNATAIGLVAGTYTVQVTDALGCKQLALVTIAEPALPTVSVTVDPNADFCKDGFITLTATGANFYNWTHNNSTNASVQVTQAGTYTVIGSDVQNSTCTASVSITLAPDLFECCPTFLNFFAYNAFDKPCATLMPNGQIRINWNQNLSGLDLTQSGTFGPNEDYTFNFSILGQQFSAVLNAGTASTFFAQTYALNPSLVNDFCKKRRLDIELSSIAATYTVEGFDCKKMFKFRDQKCSILSDPLAMVCNVSDVSCKGQNDGSATVNVSGGLAPYTYSWSPTPSSGQGTATASGLSQGIYEVFVVDAFGCETKKKVVIGASPLPEIKLSYEGDFCLDGSITLTAYGANFYSWTNGANGASIQITQPGTYTVYGSMVSGSKCVGVATITVKDDLFDCCPAVLDPQYLQVGGTITTDTYWPHKVILTSNVYVQQGATLDITNSDVITNYNGISYAIYVEGASVEATNSTFRPCDQDEKWLGIKVYKGGNLHLSECVVINAKTGVQAITTGTVYVSNNQFLNNRIGAYYSGTRGEKANKHIFTGNTVTIDDRTPFKDDFYGIRLDNGMVMEGQIAQNDFVLASSNSRLYGTEFYGVYLRNSQAVASHNTFTNVRSPYFQTECHEGACSFENNTIDYNQAYLSLGGEYAGVTLLASRAKTTISGNTMLNAVGYDAKNFGIYSEGADNLLAEGNTIEDFYYGIKVSNGDNINLVENTIDNAVWGIEGRENDHLQALDNHLTDVRFVGILIGSTTPHDGIAISNNYVQAIYGLVNYGIMYGNGSKYVTEDVELNHNCVKDAEYGLWVGTNQDCAPIPEITGNSLFNYRTVGMHIDGYKGNIGSCKAGTPGRNSFVSELQSALDVRYNTTKKCVLVLEGNYPVSSALTFWSYPANMVYAGNSCGIFGSSAECGQSGGYVPTEVYRNSIRKNKDILISPNGAQVDPDFESHLTSMLAEDRLEHVLGMMAVLSQQGSTESEAFVARLQGPLSSYFGSGEIAWISYYHHLGNGDFAAAALDLVQAEKESEVFEQLKVYETVKIKMLLNDSATAEDLVQLQQLENPNTAVGVLARALLNESTATHPFVYLADEVLFPYLKTEDFQNEVLDEDRFEVYPNPTSGSIQVSYRLTSEFNTGTIEVRNVHGQLVDRITLTHSIATEQLDLGAYASGMYHVSLVKDGIVEFATAVVKD